MQGEHHTHGGSAADGAAGSKAGGAVDAMDGAMPVKLGGDTVQWWTVSPVAAYASDKHAHAANTVEEAADPEDLVEIGGHDLQDFCKVFFTRITVGTHTRN